MLNKEQRTLMGHEPDIMYFPATFDRVIDVTDRKYRQEIEDYHKTDIKKLVEAKNYVALGKFWRFTGIRQERIKFDNKISIIQKYAQEKNGCIAILLNAIDKIEAILENESEIYDVETSPFLNNDTAVIEFNFDNPIKKLIFHFRYGLCESFEIEVDTKIYVEPPIDYVGRASIKESVGNDVVNIYFQPCHNDYDSTRIMLYREGMLIGTYEVSKGMFFLSISGLAYGTYEYTLSQYDKNLRSLCRSGRRKFTIQAPNNGGINTCVIR